MASQELSSRSCKVCVLEARSRIGGRTETLPLGVDVGAQWVGPKHHELLSLVQRFNLELVDQFYPEFPNHSTRLTEWVGYQQRALAKGDEESTKRYIDLVETLSLELDLDQPWTHKLAREWDLTSVQDHVHAFTKSPVVRQELLLFCQTVFACIPANTSLLFFLFCLKSGGGMEALGDGELGAQRWKIAGGISRLTEKMMVAVQQQQQHPVEFKLESVVVSVKYNDGLAVVGLQTGEEVTCRKLVLALSPLLIHKIRFEPSLPPARTLMQASMVSGRTIKVILQFSHAFWLDPRPSRDLDKVIGPVHNLFDSQVDGKPALVGLITGATAIALEPLLPEQRQALVETQLWEMYDIKPGSALLYLERVWGLEAFSQGCYSGLFPPDGSFHSFGHTLREPIADKLFFAATETATEHYGYMEGALLAGKRAARQVLE
ncbi:hypothetical protein BASA81_004154 [Batrachochytrium salamandrivorans]|nr:hypothetical protein BASA81_004154 [Batrachochytrium salamandrivorans]